MASYAYVECLINVWGANRNMSHENLEKYLDIRVRENFGDFTVDGLKPKHVVESDTDPVEFGIESGVVGTLAKVARRMKDETQREAKNVINTTDAEHERTKAQELLAGNPVIMGDSPEYMLILDTRGISLWPDEHQMESIQESPENWARAWVYFE